MQRVSKFSYLVTVNCQTFCSLLNPPEALVQTLHTMITFSVTGSYYLHIASHMSSHQPYPMRDNNTVRLGDNWDISIPEHTSLLQVANNCSTTDALLRLQPEKHHVMMTPLCWNTSSIAECQQGCLLLVNGAQLPAVCWCAMAIWASAPSILLHHSPGLALLCSPPVHWWCTGDKVIHGF